MSGGWYTDMEERKVVHRRTGARNMREHRIAKMLEASARNESTPDWRRSVKAKRKEIGSALDKLAGSGIATVRVGPRGQRRRPHRPGSGAQPSSSDSS
jgi:hypothetical protein